MSVTITTDMWDALNDIVVAARKMHERCPITYDRGVVDAVKALDELVALEAEQARIMSETPW